MYRSFRSYGKTLRTWISEDESGAPVIICKELEYADIYADGRTIKGTEDFSPQRLEQSHMQVRWIYTWDGKRRNKGGHRWFEERGAVRIRKADLKAARETLKARYGAELVELRK